MTRPWANKKPQSRAPSPFLECALTHPPRGNKRCAGRKWQQCPASSCPPCGRSPPPCFKVQGTQGGVRCRKECFGSSEGTSACSLSLGRDQRRLAHPLPLFTAGSREPVSAVLLRWDFTECRRDFQRMPTTPATACHGHLGHTDSRTDSK